MRKLRIGALAVSLLCPAILALGQEEPAAQPSHPANPPAEVSSPAPASTTTDPVEIIRRVAAHDEDNQKKERNYTYVQYVIEKKLGDNGEIKSTETRTYDVMVIYGEQVERQTAKDDKPLPPKDAAKEEEKIDKLIEKYKNETEDQRQKRLEKAEKAKEEDRAFVKDIAEAFNFTMLPPEVDVGHTLYRIQAEPKPNFQPTTKEGKYLTKFRGTIWVDPIEYQWVKVDIELTDTVSFGWVLARFHKGTHIHMEQTRVNDEVWLPMLVHLNLGARILLKGMNYDVTQTYRDYKKFTSQSKIVMMGEAEETPKK